MEREEKGQEKENSRKDKIRCQKVKEPSSIPEHTEAINFILKSDNMQKAK